MGRGAVVRDHLGSLKLACDEDIESIVVPKLADAMAARRALEISKANGFRRITLTWIESRSFRGSDRSPIGSVIADIKCLPSETDVCSLKHIGRKLNVVAHILARNSKFPSCNLYFYGV